MLSIPCDQIDEVLRKWRGRPSDPLEYLSLAGPLLAEVRAVGEAIDKQVKAKAFRGRAADKVQRRLAEMGAIHNQIVDDVAGMKRL